MKDAPKLIRTAVDSPHEKEARKEPDLRFAELHKKLLVTEKLTKTAKQKKITQKK